MVDARHTSEPVHLDQRRLNTITTAFRVGTPRDVSYLPQGLMNHNWRLATDRGQWALKHITDVPAAIARRNLRVVTHLAERGIPVGPPVLTHDAESVLEVDGHAYCLTPWIEGEHLAGPDLSADQAHELGTTLGHIHRHLNQRCADIGLDPVTSPQRSRVTTPDDALADADGYLTAADTGTTAFDDATASLLRRRKTLIAQYGDHRPQDGSPAGPAGWTHGDVQHRNVIWRNGHIAAVIDWDRIRRRPFAEEVARTATVQFGSEQGTLDLARTAAFVTGYRTVIDLPVPALADGVHRLWWKRMSDFWHLDFHYARDDHGCDDLFLAGEQFLEWWTQHSDEVHRAFAAQP